MKKYSWNFDEYAEAWGNDTFDTIEECLAAASEENRLDGNQYAAVYIGENIPFTPSVASELLLDSTQEQALDFAGPIGRDWDAYDHKKRSELDELDDELTEVVHKWMRKYNYYPEIYRIDNIAEYQIGDAT